MDLRLFDAWKKWTKQIIPNGEFNGDESHGTICKNITN